MIQTDDNMNNSVLSLYHQGKASRNKSRGPRRRTLSTYCYSQSIITPLAVNLFHKVRSSTYNSHSKHRDREIM